MNTEQIELLSSLDPEGLSGTVQSVLFQKNIDKLDYTTTLEYLLSTIIREKAILGKEYQHIISWAKVKGLDVSEIPLMGEKE